MHARTALVASQPLPSLLFPCVPSQSSHRVAVETHHQLLRHASTCKTVLALLCHLANRAAFIRQAHQGNTTQLQSPCVKKAACAHPMGLLSIQSSQKAMHATCSMSAISRLPQHSVLGGLFNRAQSHIRIFLRIFRSLQQKTALVSSCVTVKAESTPDLQETAPCSSRQSTRA